MIVMDISMPGWMGSRRGEAILEVHPSARIVFRSGTDAAKKQSEACAYGVVVEKNVTNLRAELHAAAA